MTLPDGRLLQRHRRRPPAPPALRRLARRQHRRGDVAHRRPRRAHRQPPHHPRPSGHDGARPVIRGHGTAEDVFRHRPYRVAGKTGTARASLNARLQGHCGSFVVLAERPAYTIAVVVQPNPSRLLRRRGRRPGVPRRGRPPLRNASGTRRRSRWCTRRCPRFRVHERSPRHPAIPLQRIRHPLPFDTAGWAAAISRTGCQDEDRHVL